MYTKHRKQNVVYKPRQCRDAPTARLTMSQPSGVATNEIVAQNRSLRNCLVLKKLTQKSTIMISRHKNYVVYGSKLGGLRPKSMGFTTSKLPTFDGRVWVCQ